MVLGRYVDGRYVFLENVYRCNVDCRRSWAVLRLLWDYAPLLGPMWGSPGPLLGPLWVLTAWRWVREVLEVVLMVLEMLMVLLEVVLVVLELVL